MKYKILIFFTLLFITSKSFAAEVTSKSSANELKVYNTVGKFLFNISVRPTMYLWQLRHLIGEKLNLKQSNASIFKSQHDNVSLHFDGRELSFTDEKLEDVSNLLDLLLIQISYVGYKLKEQK